MTKITITFGEICFFWNLTARWLVLWDQVVAMCLVHIAWPPWWLDKWLISPICCAADLNNFGGILQIISSVFHLATVSFFPFSGLKPKVQIPSRIQFDTQKKFEFHLLFNTSLKKLINCNMNWEKNKDLLKIIVNGSSTTSMLVHLLAWSSKQKFAFEN